MIRFAAPEWALLIPIILFVVWRWPVFRRPLRIVTLVLLLLLLVQPEYRSAGRGLDLWVLADRSASAANSIEAHLPEWEQILDRSKRRDDRLFIVDYAEEAVLRDSAAGVSLPGGRERTRTALATHYALSQMSPDRTARILVLSDGFSTEPLGELSERLLRQRVVLDYRLGNEAMIDDYQVDSLTLPTRAQPGESLLLEMRVSGPAGGRVPFVVTRDGAELTRGTVEVVSRGKSGYGVVRFTDKLNQPGGHYYTARILPANDPRPGNNEAARWVEIAGGPRILLVTGYTSDPLVAVLRAQGFEVEVVENPAALNAGRLQGARAVILNNVPANLLPRRFLDALDFFVRGQGGGLVMAGGKSSFARGGYFGSPIADLLPVSMELRQEQRKLSVAMAIVLDRSGSMGASTKSGAIKMDLADAGAARAVELLGPMDQVAVYAVDTEPHEIVPLSVIGSASGELGDRIRRITSGGGGIYVYTGLHAANEELRQSPRGQRHIILFADAADAEEPGSYKELLAQMKKEGTTVSVIGLGTENDKDASFLKDVAERGGGRIFFTNDAGELPSLFEQETVAIARSAFIEESAPVVPQAGWTELAARPLRWLPSVDGYNLSYLRPGASVAALTQGSEDDPTPLVAFWQRESGRVVAISFPLGGAFSASVRAWPEYGDFVQTVARWALGETAAPGIALRASVEGTELSANLLFDESWEQTLALHPPRLVISGSEAGTQQTLVWERMEPGRYRASASLSPGQSVRGAVQIGKTVLPFGPLDASSGVEWEIDPAKPAELAAVSQASGGVNRLDLSTIWDAPRPEAFQGIQSWLLTTLLVTFLLDALFYRMGWDGRVPLSISKSRSSLPKPVRIKRQLPPIEAPTSPKSPEPTPPSEPNARSERFKRAKQGR